LVILGRWNYPSPEQIQLPIPIARKQVFVCADRAGFAFSLPGPGREKRGKRIE